MFFCHVLIADLFPSLSTWPLHHAFYFCDSNTMCNLQDVIIVGGRNYHPTDIEPVINAADPAVRLSATFAVEDCDTTKIVAVVEVRNGVKKGMYEKIANGIRQKVSEENLLYLSTIVLIHERTIPKTSSGKLQRRKAKVSFH